MVSAFWIASDGGIVVGNPTGGSKGGRTINANAVYDDNTQISALNYVFDDSSYIHLSIEAVKDFVKKHAHLPWITGRAELKDKKISIGQRMNEVLESLENLWLYIQQLFEQDKEQDQRIDKLDPSYLECFCSNAL